MVCGHEFLMCTWWNEGNLLISVDVCVCVCVCVCVYVWSTCVCVSGWWVMFARLFSNTVMGIGTFARVCHLVQSRSLITSKRERPTSRGGHTRASHEDDKKEHQTIEHRKKGFN